MLIFGPAVLPALKYRNVPKAEIEGNVFAMTSNTQLLAFPIAENCLNFPWFIFQIFQGMAIQELRIAISCNTFEESGMPRQLTFFFFF